MAEYGNRRNIESANETSAEEREQSLDLAKRHSDWISKYIGTSETGPAKPMLGFISLAGSIDVAASYINGDFGIRGGIETAAVIGVLGLLLVKVIRGRRGKSK